jgi:hypothetical protein
LLKCPHHPKWSVDSMKFPSKYQLHSLQNRVKQSQNSYGNTKHQIAKLILNKNEQSWKHHNTWFQDILKSIVIKNSMVHGPIGQKRDSRNKTHASTVNWFWTKMSKPYIGERMTSSMNIAESTGCPNAGTWNMTPISCQV